MSKKRSYPPVQTGTEPAAATHADPLSAFRANVATGSYHAVVGRPLRRALREAARDPGLEAEIGALRLALARLLQEEGDVSRLALGVSRLARVAVQAARLREGPDDALADIASAMQRELDAIEAEFAAASRKPPTAETSVG